MDPHTDKYYPLGWVVTEAAGNGSVYMRMAIYADKWRKVSERPGTNGAIGFQSFHITRSSEKIKERAQW